jgi:hypothetical protein
MIMKKIGFQILICFFICYNFSHANNRTLFKNSFFNEQLDYNLFIKISKIENGKLEIKIVLSNQKLEYITLKNGKVDFHNSSFMIPLNNNLFFIVSPLEPCKIELYTEKEKTQLKGYQFESDSALITPPQRLRARETLLKTAETQCRRAFSIIYLLVCKCPTGATLLQVRGIGLDLTKRSLTPKEWVAEAIRMIMVLEFTTLR